MYDKVYFCHRGTEVIWIVCFFLTIEIISELVKDLHSRMYYCDHEPELRE